MNDNAQVCECVHDKSIHHSGISISKVNNKCCTEETTELSNTNSLLTFKTELPQDINVLGTLAIENSTNLKLDTPLSVNCIYDKSHLPKLDIPVLTSSLLI